MTEIKEINKLVPHDRNNRDNKLVPHDRNERDNKLVPHDRNKRNILLLVPHDEIL